MQETFDCDRSAGLPVVDEFGGGWSQQCGLPDSAIVVAIRIQKGAH